MSSDVRGLLAEALTEIRTMRGKLEAAERERHEPIAIVGIGCRYPGDVGSPDALWRLLERGESTVGPLPSGRWGLRGPGAPDMRQASFIADAEEFDPMFFGISPREATTMDPQQRVLLEVAYEALEDAGLPVDAQTASRTGVFVGCCNYDYGALVARDPAQIDTHTATGVLGAVLSGRIAYLLGLEGPNLVVDTACSASLVAVHLAVRSLRSRESDVALAGGVNLILASSTNLIATKIQGLAPDGRVKTFDAAANGTVRGEGCGVVVLKRLSDALRDGDHVRALIRGTAVNQDGRSTSLTSPNVLSQEAVIREALADARVEPARVGYVETHGTGTALGDPIEVEALRKVYGPPRADGSRCALGALKTNLGHTEAAAGIGGLIKAALALDRGRVPANLNFHTLNPRIELEGSALVLALDEQRRPIDWVGPAGPRMAGVSSFGVGGTNAHIILEQAPARAEAPSPPARAELLLLSARSEAALGRLAQRWAARLSDATDTTALGDLTYAAAVRRAHHGHRAAAVGHDRAELALALAHPTTHAPGAPPKVVFVFSGQGGQWTRMGRQLMAEQPAFRAALEAVDAVIRRVAGWSVLEAMGDERRLADLSVLQPVIFAFQVAQVALWRALGVEPAAVVGHSLGEIAAAHTAGALTLDEAAEVVCRRSALIETLRGHGDMALVALSRQDAQAAIGARAAEVSVAACNGPRTTVLSGAVRALEEILAELSAKGVFCRAIKAGGPGHSPQFAPLRDELVRRIAPSPNATRVPMYSSVRAALVDGRALDARYWGDNLRETVLFAPTIERLAADGFADFVEIGPHPVLSASVEETLRHVGRPASVLPSLVRDRDERATVLGTLGELWARGARVDVRAVFAGRCVPLPSYPWDHDRYFIDEPRAAPATPAPQGPHPHLGATTTVATEPVSHVVEVSLDLADAPFLADHQVHGTIVYPGTGFLELTWSGARAVLGDVAALEDVRFERVLALKPGARQPLQLVIAEESAERCRFHLSSPQPGGGFVRHVSGFVRRGTAGGPAAWTDAAPSGRRLDGPAYYQHLARAGLSFGPTFRGLTQVDLDAERALGRVEVPAAVATTSARYAAHPALLDICFQTMGAFLPITDGGEPDTMFPTHLERIVLRGPLGTGPLTTQARRMSGASDRSTASLRVLDAEGTLRVELDALTVTRLARSAVADELAGWLHTVAWTPRALDRTAGPARVYCEDAALAAALARAGAEVTPDEARADRVVIAEPGHGTSAAARVVAAVARLSARAATARLLVVTRSDGADRALTGLLRSIAYEHGELRPTWIEHDGDLPAVAREILADDPETEVALAAGARRVARLEPTHDRLATDEVVLPATGTHLITGGLGALGLRWAEYLVSRGARHLVLVGRSAPTAEARARLERLTAAGARVEIAAVDVTDRAALAALVDRLPELRGVHHLAAVLDDGAARELTEARIARVYGPKRTGAELLDVLTRDRTLEHFLLFSSAASMIGSPGQASYAAANAALDALAERRRQAGRPALSVALGVLEEARGQTERLAERGAVIMGAEAVVRALGRLLASRRQGAIGLFRFDLARWARYYPTVARTPLYGLTTETAAPSATASLADRVRSAEPSRRLALVDAHVREEVGRVLRLPPARFEPLRAWSSYGIDSLMGLEIRNRLEASTGVTLPAIVLYAEPNLAALSAHLLGKLAPEGPAAVGAAHDASAREAAPAAPPPATGDAPPSPRARVAELTEEQAAAELEKRLAALRGRRR